MKECLGTYLNLQTSSWTTWRGPFLRPDPVISVAAQSFHCIRYCALHLQGQPAGNKWLLLAGHGPSIPAALNQLREAPSSWTHSEECKCTFSPQPVPLLHGLSYMVKGLAGKTHGIILRRDSAGFSGIVVTSNEAPIVFRIYKSNRLPPPPWSFPSFISIPLLKITILSQKTSWPPHFSRAPLFSCPLVLLLCTIIFHWYATIFFKVCTFSILLNFLYV